MLHHLFLLKPHKAILSSVAILQGEGKAKLLASICAYFCVLRHS